MVVALGGITINSVSATTDAAMTTCNLTRNEASGYGRIDSVARAETATAETVAAWQESRVPGLIGWESPVRSVTAARQWTVCLYHGQFVTPTTPSADGSVAPPHDAIRLLVAESGEVILDFAGYDGRMGPETPGDWLRLSGE